MSHEGFSDSHDLSAFSLSFPESSCTADENAFTVADFNLSAPNQMLFLNASFKIVKGHRYGVLGPNGHGKTSLIRHIATRVFPLPASWDVLLVEQEARSSERTVLEEVLSADVDAVRLLREEEELLEQLEQSEMTAECLEETQQRLERVIEEMNVKEVSKQESKCRRILNGLGFFGESQDRAISSFSGGWRMRVNLAKALFMQPKLLMLDEPSNHLDLDAVLWLEKYLATEYPHTVVLISHDAEFLDAIVTDIWYVKDKKVHAYRGGFTEFEKMREQQFNKHVKEFDQYERALKNAKTKEDKERIVKKYQEIMGGAITKPVEYKVKFALTESGLNSKLATLAGIGLSEVSFSYTGTKPFVVEKVDFGLDATSRIALVGANGSGKSTVLKLLTDELQPVEGVINKNPQLRVEMFSQHFEEGLDLTVSPAELLMRTGQQFKSELCPSIEKARGMLGRFGLSSEHHMKLIGSLSGGQKARVAFAALSVRQPHLLILDEPTNHLDYETVEALILALKNFAGGVLLVSHDARLINEVECKLYICKNRKVTALDGDFEDYRKIVLDEISEREAETERINSLDREKKRELYAAKLGKERFNSVLNQGEVTCVPALPGSQAKAPVLDTGGLVFGPKKKVAKKL